MALAILVLTVCSGQALAALSLGNRGNQVTLVQQQLISLGLLSGRPDGVFGSGTKAAVQAFQRREGLTPDGVVGATTLSRLTSLSAGQRTLVHRVAQGDTVYSLARRYGVTPGKIVAANKLTNPDRLQLGQTLLIPALSGGSPELPARRRIDGDVEVLPWSEVNRLFPNGAEARVIDVKTGLVFRIRRIQGTYHADSEPLSYADTEAMREAYGGKWSWDRHPVVVEYGGRRIAASMNGYPHGTGHSSRNGFRGHFCLHFYGSQTHGTRRLDPQHQAAVLAAARAGTRRSVPAEPSPAEPTRAEAPGRDGEPASSGPED
jgi:peptidoglycan hydrolase-like protein with peptidoglycan-binding domain